MKPDLPRHASHRSILAALTMMGLMGSAHAVVYHGSWDPVYGDPFPNLSWSGTSTFYIPDSCVVANGVVSDTGPNACVGMTAGTAQVNLFDTANPSQSETLNFSQTNVDVTQATFANGELVGVDSAFFTPVNAGSFAPATFGGNTYSFSLDFGATGAELYHLVNDNDGRDASDDHNGDDCSFPPNPAVNNNYCGFSSNNQGQPVQTVVTFTPAVPEPQTYALMLAGLAVVGWSARRRVTAR